MTPTIWPVHEELTDHIRDVIERCRKNGMELPFVLCALNPQGNIFALRLHGFGGEHEVLVDDAPSGEWKTPLTIVVLDQANRGCEGRYQANG